MDGIARSVEEVDDLKSRILSYLESGYGRTFYGACQAAGLKSTSEAYNWRKEDAAFEKSIKEARIRGTENALDVAENGVMKALQGEDHKMIRWFLDRRGVLRGYIPKLLSTVTDTRPKIADDATPEQLQEAMAELRGQS